MLPASDIPESNPISPIYYKEQKNKFSVLTITEHRNLSVSGAGSAPHFTFFVALLYVLPPVKKLFAAN